jgi:hypothetical protein
MGNVSGQSERLLPSFRAAFAWLGQMGFVETEAAVSPGLIALRFAGPSAQVGVSAELSRNELLIFVAPVDEDYWERRVALESLLEAYGHPVTLEQRVVPSTDDHWTAVTAAYADALRLLRDTALVGDWSKLDQAREITAARRKADLDALIAVFEARGQPGRADVVRSIRDHKPR